MCSEDQLIDSHIQMPKVMLKRFHNKNHSFFYYDVEHKYIATHGRADSLNTEYGYYSIQIEHYLGENIETPLGKVLAYLDKIDFSQDEITVEEDFDDKKIDHIVKDFAYSLMARDPTMFKEMQNNLIHGQFAAMFNQREHNQFVRAQHDFVAQHGFEIGKKNSMFSDHIVTFMLNQTEIPFVLPISGLYAFQLNGHICVNLPISSILSLCLVHNDDAESLIRDGKRLMYLVKEPETITFFNEMAFRRQVGTGLGYVVCPAREELDRLKMKFVDERV